MSLARAQRLSLDRRLGEVIDQNSHRYSGATRYRRWRCCAGPFQDWSLPSRVPWCRYFLCDLRVSDYEDHCTPDRCSDVLVRRFLRTTSQKNSARSVRNDLTDLDRFDLVSRFRRDGVAYGSGMWCDHLHDQLCALVRGWILRFISRT